MLRHATQPKPFRPQPRHIADAVESLRMGIATLDSGRDPCGLKDRLPTEFTAWQLGYLEQACREALGILTTGQPCVSHCESKRPEERHSPATAGAPVPRQGSVLSGPKTDGR